MLEATFIASGKNMNEALEFTAKVMTEIMIGKQIFFETNKIDIFCNSADEASYLDKILWEHPKHAIFAHSLVNHPSSCPIKIGYPGAKFISGSDTLINISPDFPNNVNNYKNYLQFVVMDEGDLRHRAAETWTKCKEEGFKISFLEDI